MKRRGRRKRAGGREGERERQRRENTEHPGLLTEIWNKHGQ